jgi:hypothetical protein
MKSELVFVALPISAIVAPSAFAVQYLSVDQAQKAIFPGKSFTAAPVKLTAAQRKAIEQARGVRVLKDEQPLWRVGADGWFIVDEVVGKHEFITSAVGLNSMDRSSRLKSWTIAKPMVARFEIKSGVPNLSGRTAGRRSYSIAISKTSVEGL